MHKFNLSLAAKNVDSRLCLVTDAMQSLAGKETEFDLHGKLISLKGGKLTDKTGTLAGAHLSMDQAVRNMIDFTDISEVEALDMASSNPASALKMEDQLGAVKKGYRASLTLLDKNLYAKGVLVDGQLFLITNRTTQ